MAENTAIEWATHTINLWWGCTEVSPGCDNCYARTWANRYGTKWGNDAQRRAIESAWKSLAKMQRNAAASGKKATVFMQSMADIFEKSMPLEGATETNHLRMKLFHQISEGLYPDLIFLFLTKRPSNISKMIPDYWMRNGAPSNVWFGTSVVNQDEVRNIDLLHKHTPMFSNWFVSFEPLLGPIDLGDTVIGLFDWAIVGGESGPKSRPMHPDWATSLRDQCAKAGVHFHFKQLGEWLPMDQPWSQRSPKKLAHNEQWLNVSGGSGFHGENVWRMARVGKKAAGRLLDGVTHDWTPLHVDPPITTIQSYFEETLPLGLTPGKMGDMNP